MKKILLASALLLGVSFTSCNSYLDINTCLLYTSDAADEL